VWAAGSSPRAATILEPLPELRPLQGDAGFGKSVALSANGETALVGAPATLGGSATVFRWNGKAWAGTRIAISPRDAALGDSVALSANGTIALLGAPNADNKKGAAWIYRHSAGWVGMRLTGTRGTFSGKATFGASVALSADGSTALVGGPHEGSVDLLVTDTSGDGAAWVFTRSGSSWKQQGGRLSQSGNFGRSVALSGDGGTALIGGDNASDGKGAVWVYIRVNGKWTKIQKLAGAGEKGSGKFGSSVAVSRDGKVALVGAPDNDSGRGAVWLYTRAPAGSGFDFRAVLKSGTPSKTGFASHFGKSVALSANGSDALVASTGAGWSFRRFGAAWARVPPPVVGVGPVALSDDGLSGLLRLKPLVTRPIVTSVSPRSGPEAGGTAVTILGRYFYRVRDVWFGDHPALLFTAEAPDTIRAVSPPGQGTVNLQVFTRRGAVSLPGQNRTFAYLTGPAVSAITPSSGPSAGGTQVTITGSNFTGVTAVRFGTVAAASYAVDSATQIRAVSPPGQAGSVDVTVTTTGGTSAPSDTARFTFLASTAKVISFDDLVTGGPSAGTLAHVTTHYAPQGVTFNDVSAIDYSKGSFAIVDFAHSGTVAVEPCVGVELCTQPVAATFASPQRAACVWVGYSFKLDQPAVVELRALDGAGTTVATATTTLPANPSPSPIRKPLQVGAASAVITEIRVSVPGGYDNGLAVDDVASTTDAQSIAGCG
jgi:hypothetical protein